MVLNRRSASDSWRSALSVRPKPETDSSRIGPFSPFEKGCGTNIPGIGHCHLAHVSSTSDGIPFDYHHVSRPSATKPTSVRCELKFRKWLPSLPSNVLNGDPLLDGFESEGASTQNNLSPEKRHFCTIISS